MTHRCLRTISGVCHRLSTQSTLKMKADWVLNLLLKWSQIEYSIYDRLQIEYIDIYGSLQTPDGVHRHLWMTTGEVRRQLTGHCGHYIDNFRSLITQSRININIDWVLNLLLKWSQIEYSIYDRLHIEYVDIYRSLQTPDGVHRHLQVTTDSRWST